MSAGGVLFVDDEPDLVEICAEIVAEAHGVPAEVVTDVATAVHQLHERAWDVVVMDLFVPLGNHPHRVLSPRARRYQDHVDHLGGLVLLEEVGRLRPAPVVLSYTASTDHVLLALFEGRVSVRIPKPSPLEVLLHGVNEALAR